MFSFMKCLNPVKVVYSLSARARYTGVGENGKHDPKRWGGADLRKVSTARHSFLLRIIIDASYLLTSKP